MKNLKFIFLAIILAGLFLPLVSLAGEYVACKEIRNGKCIDPITVTFEGLVPCGGDLFDKHGHIIGKENPCQLCHLFVMFETIIDFALFRVLPPIATLMLVFGGIMFFGVAENPQKVEEAKKLLISVGIGLVVIYSAWVIITLFFIATGVMEPNIGIHDPTHWANVKCHIILD